MGSLSALYTTWALLAHSERTLQYKTERHLSTYNSIPHAGRSLLVVAVALMSFLSLSTVHADDFAPPPDPRDVPPHLAGEFVTGLTGRLYADPICPGDSACVLGVGGFFGASLLWRWPRGFVLGFGYDLTLLDGNGVYETTTVQYLHVDLRYRLLRDQAFHPFIAVDVGPMILGDAFGDNAFGVALSAHVGTEIEISSGLAFTTSLGVRAFTTQSFTSFNDGVARSSSFGVNMLIFARVGILLVERP